jgi:hypothetical protein
MQPHDPFIGRAFVRFPAAEARYVRLEIYNDQQWTFLSEVRFLSANSSTVADQSRPLEE